MGIYERDYMRAERPQDYRPRPSRWPSVLGFAVAALVVGYIAKASYEAASRKAGSKPAATERASGMHEQAPQPAARRNAAPLALPDEGARVPVAQPAPVADSESPFVKPGTIYRCRSYSGGLFWAQAHCSQHKALIDRIASVPTGMSFDQQVRIAEGQVHAIEADIRATEREARRQSLCASLQYERDAIWRRSGSGAGYVPLDVLGADQTRWKQIDALMRQNACLRR